jgi:hypothetical protein
MQNKRQNFIQTIRPTLNKLAVRHLEMTIPSQVHGHKTSIFYPFLHSCDKKKYHGNQM